MKKLFQLWRDECGGPLIEAALVLPIILVFSLGAVDWLFYFYQATSAAKAVETGARLAAVSDPVASGLTGDQNIAVQAVDGTTVLLGDSMPDFEVTCSGASASCSCTRGTCTGLSGYNSAAMQTIVYGRGSTACGDATRYYNAGMCDILKQIAPANVKVVYSQTGLGYAGRVDGPVPTITVSLQNLNYTFFFLSALPGFSKLIPMRSFSTTITGEGLTSAGIS